MNLQDIILRGTNILRKNQYPVGKVGALDFKYVPRTKQLFVKAQARTQQKDSFSQYLVQLTFSQVTNSDTPDKTNLLKVNLDGGGVVYIPKISATKNNLQVRCTCKDDYFMWQYPNKQKKALIGKFKPYVRKTTTYPERNPTKTPGMCKHSLALVKVLMQNGLIADNKQILEYLNRPRRTP